MMESFSPVDLTIPFTAESILKESTITTSRFGYKILILLVVLLGVYFLLRQSTKGYNSSRQTEK